MMDPFDLRQWPGFPSSEEAIIDQVCIDSRRISSPRALFFALPGKHVDGHQFVQEALECGAAYAVVKRGEAQNLPSEKLLVVDDPLRALQEIAQAYRESLSATFIAITGSYGKTMVKDLLARLLCCSASPESFNSQIGVPLSLFTFSKTDEIAIVEAGFSLPGEIASLARMIQPQAVLVTPVGRKHLGKFGSMEKTVEEMTPLLSSATQWVLLPEKRASFRAPTYAWSLEHPSLPHASATTTKLSSKIPYEITFPDSPPFTGVITSGFSYYLRLLNMALKAAALCGIDSETLKERLQHYRFEPMRQEIWESEEGALILNDVYGSDPQSVDQALQTLSYGEEKGKKIFVFGGLRGKDQGHEVEYRRIGQALAASPLDEVYLFGSHLYDSLIQEAQKRRSSLKFVHKPSQEACFSEIRNTLKAGDTVVMKGKEKLPMDHLSHLLGETTPQNRCLINLAAVEANLAQLRQKLGPKTRLMAIVKAFAYGTGMTRMARFYLSRGIDLLGVSTVDEAIQLRKAGISSDLFVIHAPFYEAKRIADWNLEVGVSNLQQIEALEQENKPVRVHLHADTGMNRFGCRLDEVLPLAKQIAASPSLVLQGFMTHLACADDPSEDSFTHEQIAHFRNGLRQLHQEGIEPPYIHAAASSGVIRFDLPECNLARVGLAILGLHASEATRKAMDLHLAISLISRIVSINHCRKGETISYGRKYRIEKEEQTIAVLPIGYHDGLHRHYSGRGYVSIRGHRAPMVGNICMDFLMVDVTDIPQVAVGDSALIFGEDELGQALSPEEFASWGDSITHELITCLGPRIHRVFVYEEMEEVKESHP